MEGGVSVADGKQKLDRCVLCGCETPYDRQTPVKKRNWYVEGAGQLCRDCCCHVYGQGTERHENAV